MEFLLSPENGPFLWNANSHFHLIIISICSSEVTLVDKGGFKKIRILRDWWNNGAVTVVKDYVLQFELVGQGVTPNPDIGASENVFDILVLINILHYVSELNRRDVHQDMSWVS